MNQQEQRPISDYQLERYLLRELPAADLAAVAREIAVDPALGERLAAIERSNEELHRRFLPEWMSGQIELKRQISQQRETKQQRSGYRLWAVPAVALLLAVVAVPALFDASPEQEPQIRIKGGADGPQLTIFRKAPNGEERLSDGALARSGDLVQIIYRSDGLKYGAILSVDGRGVVTQHLPAEGEKAVSLAAQDTLNYAYQLDDAPRWERFVFVAADIRFDLQQIVGQLNAGSTLASTAELRYFEFTLNKPSAP
ncbi:MAG TPA: hypothetical protein EYG11_16460 [Candidatus Latescibacteria bacterium]|nr:hypothetical protein [Candidatus Handelsmanbacteria bacterium]HIL10294.1 hypothetical protein [Candidatus Latescibacterota bacterium]